MSAWHRACRHGTGHVGTGRVRRVQHARRMGLSTYSIAACDLERGEWGVAVQSKFIAVGALVCWAEPEVGAIATQAMLNVGYGPQGLELLRGGATAAEVVERLTAADEGRDHRQGGVV